MYLRCKLKSLQIDAFSVIFTSRYLIVQNEVSHHRHKYIKIVDSVSSITKCFEHIKLKSLSGPFVRTVVNFFHSLYDSKKVFESTDICLWVIKITETPNRNNCLIFCRFCYQSINKKIILEVTFKIYRVNLGSVGISLLVPTSATRLSVFLSIYMFNWFSVVL